MDHYRVFFLHSREGEMEGTDRLSLEYVGVRNMLFLFGEIDSTSDGVDIETHVLQVLRVLCLLTRLLVT